jgi:predicted amidohydrolase
MDIKLGEKLYNLQRITSLVDKCALQTKDVCTHIICLPELSTTGFDLKNHENLAEKIPGGDTTIKLQKLASKHSVYIVTSYIEEDKGEYFNCGVIIDSHGEFIHKYRKIHLFPLEPMDESLFFTGGDFPSPHSVIDIEGMKFGLLICFDIRYPEISRRLTLDGADCLIYIAEFPRPRDDVWINLLKARAIENQVFVVGVNRVGGYDQVDYFGKSMVIDPLGNVLKKGSTEEEILTQVLDPEQLKEAQRFIPTLDLRRPNQY